MTTKGFTLISILLVTGRVAWSAANLSETLQQGLLEEEANHNLDAAIQAYQSVIGQHEDQKKIVATAVFRLGECYRKQGRTNDAVAQYQRVLSDFGDQTALTDLSRRNLAALNVTPGPGVTGSGGKGQVPTFQDAEEASLIQRYEEMAKNSPDLLNAKKDRKSVV